MCSPESLHPAKSSFSFHCQLIIITLYILKELYSSENIFTCILPLIFSLNYPQQWHATPVLSPGKSHRWRSLLGCSSWGCWKSDTTERLHFHFSLSRIGEGNGNPLQCSCLEDPRDGGAWWAAVSGVAQSRTRLKWLSSSSSSSSSNFRVKQLMPGMVKCRITRKTDSFQNIRDALLDHVYLLKILFWLSITCRIKFSLLSLEFKDPIRCTHLPYYLSVNWGILLSDEARQITITDLLAAFPLYILFLRTQFCLLGPCPSLCVCSALPNSETRGTVARQAPLPMGFFRQEHWSGLPFPPPGDLPDPGIKPASPASAALAGRFFMAEPPGKP